jgi:hypothetical protein
MHEVSKFYGVLATIGLGIYKFASTNLTLSCNTVL